MLPDRLGARLEVLQPVGATLAVSLAGYVILAAFALALGVLVTEVVVGGSLGRGDLDIARWFAERRTPFRDDLSLVGSYLAETVTVLGVMAIALIVLAVRRRWSLFGFLVVTMALEGGVYAVATFAISRNRPPVARLEDLIVADSFPSGHTAAAVALYGSLAIVVWAETRSRAWRTLAIVLAVLGPIIVATSRIYRGMHNPTDVICGALIGMGCIAVGYLAVRTGVSVARERRADRVGDPRATDHGQPREAVAS
jgi:membrane-associated phospholipid phosphatase